MSNQVTHKRSDRKRFNKSKRNKTKNVNVSNKDSRYYSLSIVKSNPYPLPDTWRCTLPYYQQVNFVANTTPQIYVFRGNAVFDPDQTGTGSQPVGYDNLSVFYNSNFVVGSRIEVRIANRSTIPIQVSITPTIASNTLSSFDQSQYYGRHVVTGFIDGTGNGSSSVKTHTNQITTLGFLSQPYDKDMQANQGSNPSKQWYWTIALQTPDQATTLTLNMQITLYYDVIFSEPYLVALS